MTRPDLILIVRAAMERKRLTQAATAEAAGMTAANLSDWLRGVSDIRSDALLRLLTTLGLRVWMKPAKNPKPPMAKRKTKRSKVRVQSYEPANCFTFFVTIPCGEIADAVKDGPAGIAEMVSAYQHLLGAEVRAKVEEKITPDLPLSP